MKPETDKQKRLNQLRDKRQKQGQLSYSEYSELVRLTLELKQPKG